MEADDAEDQLEALEALCKSCIFVYVAIEPIQHDDHDDLGLNFVYYTKMAAFQMIDVSFINCLVGRVPVDSRMRQWAIVDRS
jgi:hypothetical protein